MLVSGLREETIEMSMRALITGIAGFAGSYLAEALLEEGDHVEGLCLPDEPVVNIEGFSNRIVLHTGDLGSPADVSRAIRKARPDVIYHLAAISSIPLGEENPKQMLDTNFIGTLNLANAIQKEAPKARLVYISSSEVYGKVAPGKNPVRESQPVAPIHFYGFTKMITENFLRYWFRTRGRSVVFLRPFNHIGPRQSERFVCSIFSKQAAAIQEGKQDPVMRVGNLSPVRDFTDVRDMVRAYRLAAERCKDGIPYHIASGKGTSIEKVLSEILSFVSTEVDVQQDPALYREIEIPVLTGDASLFSKTTGWNPRFELTDSLRDLFTFWTGRWKEVRE